MKDYENKEFAPVVLFVYTRLSHTRETVRALSENKLASKTDLIIYSDLNYHEKDKYQVEAVRNFIRTINGFRTVKIIERDRNYGLARNIIAGVTEVCSLYGRVIVLEDDLVTSPMFLTYMNDALVKYKNEKKVWHISGWNYPVKLNLHDNAFFWRTMNCWGWATWSDRWENFKKEPAQIVNTWSQDKITKFNLDGCYDFYEQILHNNDGTKSTWAIFWYATIFNNEGLCLNPRYSFVKNIGNDGSGENCGKKDIYKSNLIASYSREFPVELIENVDAIAKIKEFYKRQEPSRIRLIIRKVRDLLFR